MAAGLGDERDPPGRAGRAAAGLPHRHAPVPVRELRRGVPRLGPRAAPRRSALVRAAHAGQARLPGGQVPPRDGCRTATCCASRTRAGGRAPATRRSRSRDEHARAVRVDRPRRRPDGLPRLVEGFDRAQAADDAARRPRSSASTACRARRCRRERLNAPEVWEALLEDMPMTALIRNLATLTRVGVLAPGSAGTARVVGAARRRRALRRARVHPIAVLAALLTYGRAAGARQRRVDAGRRGRRRARRRVLRGVRERRAGRQAHAARARRVGLDDAAAGSRACRG